MRFVKSAWDEDSAGFSGGGPPGTQGMCWDDVEGWPIPLESRPATRLRMLVSAVRGLNLLSDVSQAVVAHQRSETRPEGSRVVSRMN